MELFGFIAGFIITVATLPQLFQCIKHKSTRGMNSAYILLMNIGLFLWIIHGLLIHDVALIIFNIIGFVQWFVIMILKSIWG